jgi:DNA-binding transcriptional ArsR family regulator
MVEYSLGLDSVFGSLADPTRRDILRRVSRQRLTVGEIAKPYDLTFAAVSKHLKVLERAKLIIKRRRGKEQMVSLAPQALAEAAEYLQWYRQFMDARFDALEDYLSKEVEHVRH